MKKRNTKTRTRRVRRTPKIQKGQQFTVESWLNQKLKEQGLPPQGENCEPGLGV